MGYMMDMTFWQFKIAMNKHPALMGKPSTNWPFSIAKLDYQRVCSGGIICVVSYHRCCLDMTDMIDVIDHHSYKTYIYV